MKWITILFAVLMSITLVSGSYYSFSDEISLWEFNTPESNTTFTPDSTGVNDGVVNDLSLTTEGYIGSTYDCNADFDYVEVAWDGNWSNIVNMSMSFWIKYIFSADGDYIIDSLTGKTFVVRKHTDNRLLIYAGNNSGTYEYVSGLTNNTWHHIAWTFEDNGLLKTYLDGVFEGSDGAESFDWSANDSITFCVREGNKGSSFTTGKIDELYMFNRTISADEIKEIYSCRTPNDGLGTWNVIGDCTVTDESNTYNETLLVSAGSYKADNTNLTVFKAIAEGGKIVATNGGKIIAGN